MGIFEGLNRHTYNKLGELNSLILSANAKCGGVRFVWNLPPFHGKIYRIKYQDELLYFPGSLNFYQRGLFNNRTYAKTLYIAHDNFDELYALSCALAELCGTQSPNCFYSKTLSYSS